MIEALNRWGSGEKRKKCLVKWVSLRITNHVWKVKASMLGNKVRRAIFLGRTACAHCFLPGVCSRISSATDN